LSNYFDDVIKILKDCKIVSNNLRLDAVILNTNGIKLYDKINIIKRTINFINISRHHYDENVNRSIFNTNNIPDNEELEKIISACCKAGIEVTLNCILPLRPTKHDKTGEQFVTEYINFAKSVGASSVAFRKQHGNLNPHRYEKTFNDYIPINEGGCGVCRYKVQSIKGLHVYWKTAVEEPSKTIKRQIYELIIQPNGLVTADWKGKLEITIFNKKLYISKEFEGRVKEVLLPINDYISKSQPASCAPVRIGCGC